MSIIGVIPARGGSKGIPRKNIKLLNHKPLIAYTIEAARSSKVLDQVIVSTDDEDIAQISKSLGAEVSFRPNQLAQDDTPMVPVLAHVLHSLKDLKNVKGVMTLQPTSPLRTSRHISQAIDLFAKHHGVADSLVSVVICPHQYVPESIMVLEGGFLRNYKHDPDLPLRRQDKPTYYARNGAAIYLSKPELILTKNRILGDKIIPFFMTKSESVDIDDVEDWELVEALLARQ